jgi:hypothetical protein
MRQCTDWNRGEAEVISRPKLNDDAKRWYDFRGEDFEYVRN